MKNEKILGLSNDEYRAREGVSNSDLILMGRSASDYIWSKDAPRDNSNTGAVDYGTALHAAILEPETFNDSVIVWTNTKTRETKAFIEFAAEQPDDKVILLESEYDKLRFTVDGLNYHPAINRALAAKSDNEASIFVYDNARNIMRKIRPDKDSIPYGGIMLDIKGVPLIDDLRDTARWKNPLFTHNYAHNAAYYMDTGSIFYGEQINEYHFLAIQKTIEIGRYPAAIIKITREELEQLGAFDEMNYNLDKYATCLHNNEWEEVERFPIFNNGFDDDIEVTLIED